MALGSAAQQVPSPYGHYIKYPYQEAAASARNLIQAPNGNLWGVTVQGLFEFDGQSYYWYTRENTDGALPETYLQSLVRWGDTLVIGTYSKGICWFDLRTHTFHPAPALNPRLSDQRITHLYTIDAHRILLGTHLTGLELYNRKTNARTVLTPRTAFPEAPKRGADIVTSIQPREGQPGTYWVSTLGGLFVLNLEKEAYTDYFPLDKAACDNPEAFNGHEPAIRCFVPDGPRALASTWGGGIIDINLKTKRFYTYKYAPAHPPMNNTNSIPSIVPMGNKVWAACGKDGFAMFSRTTKTFDFVPDASGKSMLSDYVQLFQLGAGSVWASASDGLYLFDHSTNFLPLQQPLPHGWAVVPDGNNWLTLQRVDARTIISQGERPVYESRQDFECWQTAIAPDGTLWWPENDGLFHKPPNGKPQRFNAFEQPATDAQTVSSFLLSGDSLAVLGKKYGGMYVVRLADGSFELYDDELVHRDWINELSQAADGSIWYGTESGLGILNLADRSFSNLPETQFAELPFRLQYVQRILHLPNGNVWIACNNQGLVQLAPSANGWEPVQWFEADAHTLETYTDLAVTADGQLWISSYNGLAVLLPEADELLHFGHSYGLHSIRQLVARGDSLFALSARGLCLVNRQALLAHQPQTKPYLRSLSVLGKPLAPPYWVRDTLTYPLAYTDQFLELEIGYRQNQPPTGLEAAYRLLPDTHWHAMANPHRISLTYLPANRYALQLRTRNLGSHWQQHATLLGFYLPRPFWQQTWFYALCGVLGLAIIWLIFRLRLRQVQQKEALKRSYEQQLTELELEALQSQINPHFIFNCLNSIRFQFLTGQLETGQQYVERFSDLLRFVLQNARADAIALSEELEALENYIALEQMRFNPPFEYRINTEQAGQLTNHQVPPMLMQPFVENALWHGLSHLDGAGKLSVTVRFDAPHLYIVIEDNGIGRTKAAEYAAQQPKRKKSQGVHITERRLLLDNDRNQRTSSIHIDDLHHADGRAAGTRVTVKLDRS